MFSLLLPILFCIVLFSNPFYRSCLLWVLLWCAPLPYSLRLDFVFVCATVLGSYSPNDTAPVFLFDSGPPFYSTVFSSGSILVYSCLLCIMLLLVFHCSVLWFCSTSFYCILVYSTLFFSSLLFILYIVLSSLYSLFFCSLLSTPCSLVPPFSYLLCTLHSRVSTLHLLLSTAIIAVFYSSVFFSVLRGCSPM